MGDTEQTNERIQVPPAMAALEAFLHEDASQSSGPLGGALIQAVSWLEDRVSLLEGFGRRGWRVAALLLARTGRTQEALALYSRVVEDCRAPDGLYEYIHLLQIMGRWDESGRALNVAVGPSDPLLGLHMEQARFEGGRVGLNEAYAAAADQVDANGRELLRARHGALTGSAASLADGALLEGRDFFAARSERLRVQLMQAVCTADPDALEAGFRHAVFSFFPQAEQDFYRGVRYWLDGELSSADRSLSRAVRNAPGARGPRRCLAQVKESLGRPGEALRYWRDEMELGVGDDPIWAVRHAVAQHMAFGGPEPRLALRRISQLHVHSERIAQCYARVCLRDTLNRVRLSGSMESSTSLLDEVENVLEGVSATSGGAWLAWLVSVLRSSAGDWISEASRLIETEPRMHASPCIPLLQWVRGLLRAFSGETGFQCEGLEILAACPGVSDSAKRRVLPWLFGYAARAVRDRAGAEMLRATGSELVRTAPDVQPGLLRLSDRLEDLPAIPESRKGGEQGLAVCALRRVRSEDRSRIEAAMADAGVHSGSHDTETLLTLGILALSLGDQALSERLASLAQGDARAEQLRAVGAVVGDGNAPEAVAAVVAALAEMDPGEALVRPERLLAFATVKARGRAKGSRAKLLPAIEGLVNVHCLEGAYPDLTAMCFLALVHLDASDAALALVDRFPQVPADLARAAASLLCKRAAALIEEERWSEALAAVEAIDADGYGDLAEGLLEVVPVVRARAMTSRLLRALAPHSSSGASVGRFIGLNRLAAEVPDEELTHLIRGCRTTKGRDALRSRLVRVCRDLVPDKCFSHLRMLAILHWEWGVQACESRPVLAEESTECFVFASFLFRRLFLDGGLAQFMASEFGLGPEHCSELVEQVEDEVLDLHRDQAIARASAEDAVSCEVHLSCLKQWDLLPPIEYGAPSSMWHAPDADPSIQRAAERLRTKAQQRYDAWVDDVLARARARLADIPDLVDDPDAPGHDYMGAMRTAQQGLNAQPDEARLAVFYIEQADDLAWFRAQHDDIEGARALVNDVVPRARMVANRDFRAGGLVGPAGQVLDRTFNYAHQVAATLDEEVERMNEYLYWHGPDAATEASLRVLRVRKAIADGRPHEACALASEIAGASPVALFNVRQETADALVKAAEARSAEVSHAPDGFFSLSDQDRRQTVDAITESHRQAVELLEQAQSERSPDAPDLSLAIANLRLAADRAEWTLARDLAEAVLRGERSAWYEAAGDFLGDVAVASRVALQVRAKLRAECYLGAARDVGEAGDTTRARDLFERAGELLRIAETE